MTSPRRGTRGRGRSDDAGDATGLAGASGATLRGALLIAVAVVVGVVLLGKGFDTGFLPTTSETPSERAADDDDEGDGGDDGAEESTTTTSPPTTHAANQVRVIVLNGGGPTGAAGDSTTALGTAGYTTLEAGNSDPPVPATVVYFTPEYQADAAAIATSLGITAEPQPMPATPPPGAPPAGEVDVVVILGPDFTAAG